MNTNETPVKDDESEGKKASERAVARAKITAEKFITQIPKTGNNDTDMLIALIAKKSYLAGRMELGIEVMDVL